MQLICHRACRGIYDEGLDAHTGICIRDRGTCGPRNRAEAILAKPGGTCHGDNNAHDLAARMQGASMIKVWTQTLAVAFAVVQGANRAIELRHFALRQAGSVVTETMMHLVAGAMLLRWAVDQNSAHGMGDGISLLICAGIAARECCSVPHLPACLWHAGNCCRCGHLALCYLMEMCPLRCL